MEEDKLLEKIDEMESLLEKVRDSFIDSQKHTYESFKKIDSNFEIIDSKIDEVNEKLDNLEESSSKEFKNVGGKLDELKREVKKIEKVSNYSKEYANLLKISK